MKDLFYILEQHSDPDKSPVRESCPEFRQAYSDMFSRKNITKG